MRGNCMELAEHLPGQSPCSALSKTKQPVEGNGFFTGIARIGEDIGIHENQLGKIHRSTLRS
jgi:hypothetical protein